MSLLWAFLSESSNRLLTFYRSSSQVRSSCRTSLHRCEGCERITLFDLWQVCILSNFSFNSMLSSSNFSQGAGEDQGLMKCLRCHKLFCRRHDKMFNPLHSATSGRLRRANQKARRERHEESPREVSPRHGEAICELEKVSSKGSKHVLPTR